MLAFESDYTKGAHPAILKRLCEVNNEPQTGYGTDDYCGSAKEKIRAACQCPTAEIAFLVGGTQTNAVVISGMLRSYEGVVAATTGHVSVHEAGAIEKTGHKVLTLPPHRDAKIRAEELRALLAAFFADENQEHMVYPGMVYLSHPTENGTLYTKAELTAISQVCRDYSLPLYLDGARLGYGLMSSDTDLTLPDLTRLCDVFYIGGTKVGALFGEAVVFTRGNMPKHFTTIIKSNGALLAKGWLLGLQFDTLFTDGLYFSISRHGIEMAEKLKVLFREKNLPLWLDSPTNQQFVILENERMAELAQQVRFSYWEPYDEGHTVVRFATSWSTTAEEIEELGRIL